MTTRHPFSINTTEVEHTVVLGQALFKNFRNGHHRCVLVRGENDMRPCDVVYLLCHTPGITPDAGTVLKGRNTMKGAEHMRTVIMSISRGGAGRTVSDGFELLSLVHWNETKQEILSDESDSTTFNTTIASDQAQVYCTLLSGQEFSLVLPGNIWRAAYEDRVRHVMVPTAITAGMTHGDVLHLVWHQDMRHQYQVGAGRCAGADDDNQRTVVTLMLNGDGRGIHTDYTLIMFRPWDETDAERISPPKYAANMGVEFNSPLQPLEIRGHAKVQTP